MYLAIPVPWILWVINDFICHQRKEISYRQSTITSQPGHFKKHYRANIAHFKAYGSTSTSCASRCFPWMLRTSKLTNHVLLRLQDFQPNNNWDTWKDKKKTRNMGLSWMISMFELMQYFDRVVPVTLLQLVEVASQFGFSICLGGDFTESCKYHDQSTKPTTPLHTLPRNDCFMNCKYLRGPLLREHGG